MSHTTHNHSRQVPVRAAAAGYDGGAVHFGGRQAPARGAVPGRHELHAAAQAQHRQGRVSGRCHVYVCGCVVENFHVRTYLHALYMFLNPLSNHI